MRKFLQQFMRFMSPETNTIYIKDRVQEMIDEAIDKAIKPLRDDIRILQERIKE